MAIEINGKVYRNIQEQVAENQDNITELQHDVSAIQALIDSGEIGITIQIVETLPTEDINPHCIYLILNSYPETENVYDEYMYIEDNWELIGSTATDLTDYYTKSETDTAITNAKQIFIATQQTTFNEITQALNDGKIVIAYVLNKYWLLTNFDAHNYEFTITQGAVYLLRTRINDQQGWWGYWELNEIEKATNKKTTISSTSTNIQYPSALATYNFGTGLMTPAYMDDAVISAIGEAQFTFTGNVFNASNNKWLGTFTMGNCFFMIPLYGLTQGTTYKTNGTFVYSSLGEVVSTTVNYKITNDTTIIVWSGNSNFTMQEGYTAYLSLLRLF